MGATRIREHYTAYVAVENTRKSVTLATESSETETTTALRLSCLRCIYVFYMSGNEVDGNDDDVYYGRHQKETKEKFISLFFLLNGGKTLWFSKDFFRYSLYGNLKTTSYTLIYARGLVVAINIIKNAKKEKLEKRDREGVKSDKKEKKLLFANVSV